MVNRLIEEIQKALKAELYFSALTLALTLPDICGKAAYPELQNGKKRYIKWFDEHIGDFEKPPEFPYPPSDKEMEIDKKFLSAAKELPYLSGKVMYSLRCSVLHEGNPNINHEQCQIDEFSLIIEKEKPGHFYSGDSAERRTDCMGNNSCFYRLNLRGLCRKLCAVADTYYKENKEKFNFFNYSIVDWDEQMERMKSLGYGCPEDL